MNQVSEGGTSDAPLNMPVKRKRGRPRKDRSLIPIQAAAAPPPGFSRVQPTQTLKLDAIEDASDSIVGQAVTGVVESVFDAGYCLSVRIGNSSTRMRGLVFKPGYFVPISPENDVAPHVQMHRRNEVLIPSGKQGRPRGRHARSKEVNLGRTEVGQLLNGSSSLMPQAPPVAPQPGDTLASKGKEVALVSPLAAAPPPVGLRGMVVPVLLQPVSAASNGSLTVNQVPVLGQPQTSNNQILSNNTKVEGKKVQVTEVRNKNVPEAVKPSVVGNLNNPLSVEPLQAVHSSDTRNKQPMSYPKASDNSRIGGMSVLLQALQENMTE